MIFRQYLHAEPVVAASYLFGCAGKAMGAVVDPVEDIDPYLRDADGLGLPIRYVIDTHLHADHVSGGPRLAEAAAASPESQAPPSDSSGASTARSLKWTEERFWS